MRIRTSWISRSRTSSPSAGGSNAPATFTRNTYQVSDDVDFVRGRHHLTFGVEAIAMQMEEVNISIANGQWTFNGSLSKDALSDYLLGRPSLLSMGNPFQAGLREKYWGAYVQDDIRLAKGLNVHFGLRWEPSLPEHDEVARGSHFSLPAFLAGQHSRVYPNAPAGLLFYGDPEHSEGVRQQQLARASRRASGWHGIRRRRERRAFAHLTASSSTRRRASPHATSARPRRGATRSR